MLYTAWSQLACVWAFRLKQIEVTAYVVFGIAHGVGYLSGVVFGINQRWRADVWQKRPQVIAALS